MAGHQQRDRDGGHDEEEGRDTSGQGCPGAGLLQAGVDGLPQPGRASRARMNSPVIPASHETARYRVTCHHGGSTAKMTWYDMRQRGIRVHPGGLPPGSVRR